MCTFNIVLDDELVKTARKSFSNEDSMTAWMEEQITALLTRYVPTSENKAERRQRKHDSIMGIISGAPDLDYKRMHLSDKYGV